MFRRIEALASAPVTILPEADAAFSAYDVRAIPRTLLFGPDGALVADVEGYSPELVAEIERHLERLTAG